MFEEFKYQILAKIFQKTKFRIFLKFELNWVEITFQRWKIKLALIVYKSYGWNNISHQIFHKIVYNKYVIISLFLTTQINHLKKGGPHLKECVTLNNFFREKWVQ